VDHRGAHDYRSKEDIFNHRGRKLRPEAQP